MNVAALRLATSVALLGVALMLFAYGCWMAAADAQGAIGIIWLGPLSFAVACGALLLAREAATRGARAPAWIAAGAAGLVFALQLAFFACAFAPACRFFPQTVVAAVASVYTAVAGETPYERIHRR